MSKINDKVPRSDLVDMLRALATIYIICIWHIDDYAHNCFYSQATAMMVDIALGIFIFISGYLISSSYTINSMKDIISFIQRRFFRIYPLYVIALVGFYSCSLIAGHSLISHLLLVDMFVKASAPTLWFVSMICIFYMLYILIGFNYSFTKTIVETVGVLCLCVLISTRWDYIDERMIIYLPLFVFGIITRKHNLFNSFMELNYFNGASCLAAIACSFIYVYMQDSYLRMIVHVGFIFFSIVPVIEICAYIHKRTNATIYGAIAYTSFCMYLFHRIVFNILLRIYTPPSAAATIVYLLVIGAPLIYMLSLATQTLYDRAIAYISRQYADKPQTCCS
jgi:peptidoglycan/LPS O-acetylase OafA/YrhL